MGNNDMFSGDIDPEIASLLGLDETDNVETPDYENLFEEESESNESAAPLQPQEDISRETFLLPVKQSQPPQPPLLQPQLL